MYSYLYIFFVLIFVMFLLRLFIPVLIWLFPIIFVYIVVKSIFTKKKKNTQEEYYQYKEPETRQSYTNTDSDIIDVDYTVVDEETNTQ